MKRREFIGIAAAGAAGVVLPTPIRADASIASALSHPRLIEILHDERLVRALGRRYRDTVSGETDAGVISTAILSGLNVDPHSRVPLPVDASRLRAQVDELVHRDFLAGRTVVLKGWILSVTEARQCALYSLLPA